MDLMINPYFSIFFLKFKQIFNIIKNIFINSYFIEDLL